MQICVVMLIFLLFSDQLPEGGGGMEERQLTVETLHTSHINQNALH